MYEFLIAERLRGKESWFYYKNHSSEENVNASKALTKIEPLRAKAMDNIHTPSDEKKLAFWDEIIKLERRRGGLSKEQRNEEFKVRPCFYL